MGNTHGNAKDYDRLPDEAAFHPGHGKRSSLAVYLTVDWMV
jgi:hypothetical protein